MSVFYLPSMHLQVQAVGVVVTRSAMDTLTACMGHCLRRLHRMEYALLRRTDFKCHLVEAREQKTLLYVKHFLPRESSHEHP